MRSFKLKIENFFNFMILFKNSLLTIKKKIDVLLRVK